MTIRSASSTNREITDISHISREERTPTARSLSVKSVSSETNPTEIKLSTRAKTFMTSIGRGLQNSINFFLKVVGASLTLAGGAIVAMSSCGMGPAVLKESFQGAKRCLGYDSSDVEGSNDGQREMRHQSPMQILVGSPAISAQLTVGPSSNR